MVGIYADMIILGYFDFDNTPASRKGSVEAELNRRGYDINGEKLAENVGVINE